MILLFETLSSAIILLIGVLILSFLFGLAQKYLLEAERTVSLSSRAAHFFRRVFHRPAGRSPGKRAAAKP